MKNHFSKIVGLSLGIALAIGVGASIATSNRSAVALHAVSPQSLTTNALSGNSNDGNISWLAVKGGSGTAPAIYNSAIRLYQNGGFVQLKANNGAKINSFVAHNTATYDTTANYAVSESEFAANSTPANAGTNTSVAKSDTYSISDLNSTYVAIICRGTDKNSRFEISSIDVTFTGGSTGVITFDMSYDSNGGSGTMTDSNSPYASGDAVTVASNSFTRSGYTFSHWNTEDDDTGTDYFEDDTFNISADTTLYAQWNPTVGDLTDESCTVNFGSASGSILLTSSKKSGVDDLGISWRVVTVGTTSFTSNESYMQIGTTANPASTIQFKALNLGDTYKISSFSAKFGGFNDTAGTIALKVGNTQVGTGALNGQSDVIVTNSEIVNGSSLSIDVSGINKGVKIYYISYTLDSTLENQTITASSDTANAKNNETITLTTSATSAAWSIVSDTADASLSASSGKSTIVSANQGGSVTVQAVASGYKTVNKTLTFFYGNTYDVTFDSNGGSESPAAQVVEEDDTFVFPSAGTKEHYSFDGWTSTGSAPYYAAGATSPAVIADIAYTAHWTEDAKYTVTYSAGSNGSGSYADENHYVGTYTLLPFDSLTGVSAAEGYQFKDYTVGGVSKNPGDTLDLSSVVAVTVNFEEIPPHDVLDSSVIPAAAVGKGTGWGTASTFSDSTGAVYTGRFMAVSSSSYIGKLNDSTNGYIYTSTIPEGMKLKSVSISSMTASKTVGVYAQATAYEAAPSDKSTALGAITPSSLTYNFDGNPNYRAICLRGHSSATEIGTVTITYDILTTKDIIECEVSTASALKFDYSEIAGVYEYDNAAIRFGGFISKTQWDALDADSDIEGYGVLVAANSTLGGKTIKQRYAAAKTNENTVNDAITSICSIYSIGKKIVTSKPNPAVATSEQKAFMGAGAGDYYIWTVQKPFGDAFTTKYNAVAFILIDGDIVFLEEVSLSAKDIAIRDVPVDDQDTYYEPLHYMANMA